MTKPQLYYIGLDKDNQPTVYFPNDMDIKECAERTIQTVYRYSELEAKDLIKQFEEEVERVQ